MKAKGRDGDSVCCMNCQHLIGCKERPACMMLVPKFQYFVRKLKEGKHHITSQGRQYNDKP